MDTLPAKPNGNGRARGPLADHQKAALATMVVAGYSYDVIALSLGRTTEAVQRLIRDDETVKTRIEQLEARRARTLATHHAGMEEMLDDCRATYREALRSPDLRLRFDAARYVESRVVPKPEEKSVVDVRFQAQVHQELTGAFVGIKDLLGAVRATADPRRSIRTGPEALPTPTAATVDGDWEEPADGDS